MADTAVASMTAASALDGTELYYGVQGGADRKVTGAQVKTLASASPTITGHATIEGVTATGATGTGKFVFDTSPTITTGITIGAGSAITSSGAGGALGSNAFTSTAYAPIASPTITGHATLEGVTATGATGTGKFVFDGTPTLVTPVLGVATGTSIALGGATLGTNALAITGTTNAVGAVTLGTQQTTQGSIVLANTAAGAFATTIKSSNSATAAVTYVLPPAVATSTGYVLTDAAGDGVLSWAAGGGGGGLTVNSTTISGGAAGNILYTDASKLQAALMVYSAGKLHLGAADVSSGAVAQTLEVQSNSGASTTGPNFTIASSKGTTAGGSLILQVAATTTLRNVLTFAPTAVTTFASATNQSNGFVIDLSVGNQLILRTVDTSTTMIFGGGQAAENVWVSTPRGAVNTTTYMSWGYDGFGFGDYRNITFGYRNANSDDTAAGTITIAGNNAFASNSTNIVGGNVTFNAGSGASSSAGLATGGHVFIFGGTGFGTGYNGSVVLGTGAINAASTDGFVYIPTCAGTPSGTPTTQTGKIPMIYDTTNHQFWFYDSGWKQPKTPAGAAIVTWQ